ncbi:MAG: 4-hydroxy-3-methylbut-2-enyl diphosphate reductase [Deltaproteobacteria bacterium]|nr:MAG: 4-hydroxy-3-methylbut-2-enyl diphosphate reductase [Deltaproteobacteria bacterium]
MKVRLAKSAGFCMGVRRAMKIVLEELNKRRSGPLYTLGPLIHNNQVLDLLAAKGVRTVDDPSGIDSGEVVIRAHGIGPEKRRAIRRAGLSIIDATCPRVARVHALVRSYTRKGYAAVIVGDRNHPEVQGIMGYSEGPVHVVEEARDVSRLPPMEPVFAVAQTTQDRASFQEITKLLQERFPGIRIFNTICDATRERQQEVRVLAGQVDGMVVVGGYHSGNTRRLAQVSRNAGVPTFHVETEKDLDRERLANMQVIGITAGASTPNWMIKNVAREIEAIRSRRESSVIRGLRRTFKFLLLSNLLAAGGAFSLSFAAATLSLRHAGPAFPMLTFLYIYAMHVLNRFLDKGASAYNDPERAAFLKKHRGLLVISGIAAGIGGLVLAFHIGMAPFLVLSAVTLLGIFYSLPLVPEKYRERVSYAKIKDIPGSRGLSESLAWVTVITVLPLLEEKAIVWPAALTAFLAVLLISYVRSVLFDIFQEQGDLIVGTETLPIMLGKKKTLSLLRGILLCAGGVLIASPLAGFSSPFSYVMLIPLAGEALCLLAHEREWLYPGIMQEALVEANFYLAGLLAFLWQALP